MMHPAARSELKITFGVNAEAFTNGMLDAIDATLFAILCPLGDKRDVLNDLTTDSRQEVRRNALAILGRYA